MKSVTYMDVLDNYSGNVVDLSLNKRLSSDCFKKMEVSTVQILKNSGLCPFERVALVIKSSVIFMINFFAVIEIGAIPVLLSKMTTLFELEDYNQKYGVHWLLTDQSKPFHCIVNDYGWSLFKINEKAMYIRALKGMILQPTSGSTGLAKMCVRDEYGCFAEPQNHIETNLSENRNTIFCPLALNHAYGFGTAFLLSFLNSSELIVANEMNPRKVIKAFQEYDITMFIGVPAIYELITKLRINSQVCMPDQLLSAGAPLLKKTSEDFYRRFHKCIHPSFGSTETGEMCIEQEDIISETGSVGKPLKYTLITLEKGGGDFNRVVAINPSMMVGYLDENGNIDSSMIRHDGSFYTGDLAEFGYGHRIQLIGREKNMINVFGVKVNPYDIENVIRNFECIVDVHIYAGEHRSGSQIVLAIVQTNGTIDEQQIIDRCKQNLIPHKVPSKVFIVDKLPRNQSGKIINTELPR